MLDYIKIMTTRMQQLDLICEKIEERLIDAPENRVRLDCSGKKVRYSEVDCHNRVLKYLSEKQMDLIKALAQKSYDKKILTAVRKEKAAIEHMLHLYPDLIAEQIYYHLRPERRALITPIVETREEMIRKWREEVYETNPIPVGDTGLETDRGEIVRSRAEYMIANDVNSVGAEYHYEKELYLEGWGTVYPDFTILNVRTGKVYIWEHLGKTDDPEYVQKNIRKIEAYAKNGFYPGEKLILSSETVDPLTGEIRIDTKLIKQLVRKYCC